MEKLYTADDIEIVMHDQGSSAFDRAGGPVVEVFLATNGPSHSFSLAAAEQIGKAAARLSPRPSDHKPVPVSGYSPVSQDKIDLVNTGKEIEERLLRYIEHLEYRLKGHLGFPSQSPITDGDPRFLAIGRTQIQLGMMMIYRAVMNPGRIALPEDISGVTVVCDTCQHVEVIEANRSD